jgi:putative acetyltransferase
MVIRSENKCDIEAISAVTKAAFKNVAISHKTEHFIVNALREANALTVSLVAELDGKIVGHIAFSPVAISDGSKEWYGLGPISVLPDYQRKGIGKALMKEGLSLIKSFGAIGCVLVGDPNYYGQFGFKNIPGLIYEGIPQEYFLGLSFEENKAHGKVKFHKGFDAQG